MQKILRSISLLLSLLSLNVYAVLGPIAIYSDTEFRSNQTIVGSTASKIVLNKQDIEQSGANTFLELLETVPSINLFNTQGNVPAVFMRGTDSNHTVLLVDGVKVEDISSIGARPYWEMISLDQIEKIEIIKGINSVLYGSGAIGGVIQVFTKQDADSQGKGKINTMFGSNNTQHSKASYGITQDDLTINANISDYKTDGISARSDNDETDGKRENSVGLNMNYQLGADTALSVNMLESNKQTDYDNCSFDFVTYYDNCEEKSHFKQFTTKFTHQVLENWSSELSIGDNSQYKDYYIDDTLNTSVEVRSNRLETTWLNDITLNNQVLTIGYNDFNNEDNIDDVALSSKESFLNDQIKINEQNSFIVGARYISHAEFGSHDINNFKWHFQPNEKISIAPSYGTAFKSPSLYQLTDPFSGNLNLKPEEAKSYEIAIDYFMDKVTFRSNIYHIKVKNSIDWDGTYYNIDEDVINKGLDFSAELKPIDGYAITFSYTYNSSKQEDSDEQLVRRPKESYSATVNKRFNDKLNAQLQWTKRTEMLDTDGVTVLDGYQLVNFSLQYNLNKNWEVDLKMNNLLDEEYTHDQNYNQLGYNAYAGLSYNF